MAKSKKTESSIYDIYKNFSDLALMTLGAFLFLFVIIIMVSQMSERNEVPRLKKQLVMLEAQLKLSQEDKARLKKDLEKVIVTDPETGTESARSSVAPTYTPSSPMRFSVLNENT